MSLLKQNQTDENENTEKQWNNIYTLGGITALIVIAGTFLDIIIGSVLGGDLSTIPNTTIDRFAQLQDNLLLGLYNLDLLNFCTAILIISFGMLKGIVFSRSTAFVGILGSILLLIYVILVTFVPEIKNIAVMVAAPGGILALAWMIMFTTRLFQLGRSN